MLSDWLQQLKQSVARVDIPSTSAEVFVANGTAFLVAPSLAATSLHVIGKHHKVRLTFGDWPTAPERYGKLVWKHPQGGDLVILELDAPCPDEVSALPLGALPATSTQWSTYGYPKNVPGGHTLRDEKLVDPLKALPGVGRVLQLEAATATESFVGFSGAPCVVGGLIVGILTFQLERVREELAHSGMAPSLRTLYALPISLLATAPFAGLNTTGSQSGQVVGHTNDTKALVFEDLVVLFAEKEAVWKGDRTLAETLGLPPARLAPNTDALVRWYHILLRAYRTKAFVTALTRACEEFKSDPRVAVVAHQYQTDSRSLGPPLMTNVSSRLAIAGSLSFAGVILAGVGVSATGVITSPLLPLSFAPLVALGVAFLRSFYRSGVRDANRADRAAEGLVRRQRRSAFRWLSPYDEGDLLPGASRRTLGLAVATQLVSDDFSLGVLTGVVGCGKTSFLRSELKARLGATGRTVHLVMRPRSLDPASVDSGVVAGSATQRLDALQRVVQSRATGAPLFLLIDQFEEFFVDDPAPETITLIRRVFSKLINANVRILCAIRHDFLLHMHRLAPMLPPLAYQKNLFELREFDASQAEEVIRDCVEQDGVAMIPASLARTIADDLSKGKGRTVRPPELQIVCGSLVADFSERNYKRQGASAGVIASYIRRAIEMNPNPRVAARVLRQLCDFAPAIRNARVPQAATTIAAAIEEGASTVHVTLETLEIERVVRRVDHERFALMHDYLVDPVARATKTEATLAEEAEQLLNYHLSSFLSRRPEAIPLRRLAFVYRNAPQIRRKEKDALQVFRRSVRIHLQYVAGIALLGWAIFWIPLQFAPSSCPTGQHMRGRWASKTCVLDYSWQPHDRVEAVADGVKVDERGFVVCRVAMGNGKQVGYLSATGCHYEYDNKYYVSTTYEALLGPTDVHWGTAEAGAFPVNAFGGGSEDGHPRLVCRAKRGDTMLSGKTVEKCCSIAGESPSPTVPRGLPGICPEQFEVLLDD